MTKKELTNAVDDCISETRNALQTVYNEPNQGQRKKIVKVETVKALFDRYGVEYTE